MNYFKKYNQIWIQCIAFFVIGITKHKPLFLYLSGTLFLLVVLLPAIAKKYIYFLAIILNKTGYWLKNILFIFLFYVIFFSIALLMRITKYNRNNKIYYIEKNKIYMPIDFEKMW